MVAIEFLIEDLEETPMWIPLKITQGFNVSEVAYLDQLGSIADFDSAATEEVSQICEVWAMRLQRWTVDEQPASGVTATIRYFSPNNSEICSILP